MANAEFGRHGWTLSFWLTDIGLTQCLADTVDIVQYLFGKKTVVRQTFSLAQCLDGKSQAMSFGRKAFGLHNVG